MGRGTLLDDLVAKRICDALRDGHSYADAARHAGIGEDTLGEWLRRGRGLHPKRPENELYARFARKVDEAEHEAADRCIQVIKSNLLSDDRKTAQAAAQWWLQRRRPAQWQEQKADEPLTQEEAEALVAEAAKLIAVGGKP